MWKCPDCGHTDSLHVEVKTSVKLIQYPEEDNFETEADGDHEWDCDSEMWCTHCERSGTVSDFVAEEDDDEPT